MKRSLAGSLAASVETFRSAAAPGSGATNVPQDGQRIIDLRTSMAQRVPSPRTLKITGIVAADENRLYRLSVSSELWILKVFPPAVGSAVRKDEPLLEFFATELASAALAYLSALKTLDLQPSGDPPGTVPMQALGDQMRRAIEGLRNLGLSDADIAKMERTRLTRDLVTLRSPADGVVLARSANMGEWVASSTELYQIADLRHVWIVADLSAQEARRVRPGMRVKAFTRETGVALQARVIDTRSVFDSGFRATRVRLEAENPDSVLWPGMPVEVDFPIRIPETVTVPMEAVLDSGASKIVLVVRGTGQIEPRVVKTGWRFDDEMEIVDGLAAGDEVVVHGVPAPRAGCE